MAADTVNVAIVGGGVSGLYTGWRLAHRPGGPPGNIRVYEASDRVGGRLETVRLPGSDRRVEMGAMRFPVAHRLVHNLLQEVGVKFDPFPNLTLRRMYLRGTQIPMQEGVEPDLPYHLEHGEPKNPMELTLRTLERAVPGAVKNPDWAAVREEYRKKHGIALWQQGLWNVFESLVSNEADQLMYNGIGIESALSNWNAAVALEMLTLLVRDFMAGQFFRPTEGWSDLPERLAAALQQVPDCRVERGHELATLRKTGDAEHPIELVFRRPEGLRVRARRVVLAMPRRSLEMIQRDNVLFEDRAFERRLRQVDNIPAFRIYIDYEEPWWTSCGWSDGYTVTDLPIRQVFYGTGLHGTPEENGRMLMASYADFHTVSYWSALARLTGDQRHGRHDQLAPLLGPAERQLCTLHEVDKLPTKTWSGFVDWTRDPYGGAWHAWRPGVNPYEEIGRMRHPSPELPIYLCGEAYSHYQGWVEGALTTTERMLEEHFGMSRPGWLPGDYDLGP